MSELSEFTRSIETLTAAVQELRADLVRKDVYASDQSTMTLRIDSIGRDVTELRVEVKAAEDRRAADRRLLLTSFAIPFLLLIIQLYLASQTGAGK